MSAPSSSFVQLPSEILTDPNISALELRIYAILMDFGRKGRGFSQIGHQYLARLVGKHPQTIGKCLKNLSEKGYIVVERVGLNRNDIIRCKKTVQKPMQAEVRSERIGKDKKTITSEVPLLIDRSTKKSYKDDPSPLPVPYNQPTPPKSPQKTQDQHQQAQRDIAILEHQEVSNDLKTGLESSVRPVSYDQFFSDVVVMENNAAELVISLGNDKTDWVKEHFTTLLAKIAGKKVQIIS